MLETKIMINLLGLRKIILFLGDLFLLYLALIITLIIGFGQNLSWQIILQHLLPFSLLFPIWLFIFSLFNFYELDLLKTKTFFWVRTASGILSCLMMGVIFFYLIPSFGITPKTNLLILIVAFGALFLLWRKTALYLFSSYLQNRVAIVGITQESKQLALIIRKNPQLGYRLIEMVPDHDIGLITQKIQQLKLNTLIFARDLSEEPTLNEIFYKCLSLKVCLLDLARAYEIIAQRIPLGFVDHVWFLENLREGEKELYDKSKRLFDILFAILFLLIFSPLWLIIPLLIKLEDGGPVFYSQKRMGKNLEKITILKFRTMKENVDKVGVSWSYGKGDVRITKVGKILRYFHFDELPQMLNILKGELSFVGPRPESLNNIHFLEKEIPYYHLRHLIKPGFAGWAQMASGYTSTMGKIENIYEKIKYDFEKVEYDLYYIKNRSFVLDLSILLKSLKLFLARNS